MNYMHNHLIIYMTIHFHSIMCCKIFQSFYTQKYVFFRIIFYFSSRITIISFKCNTVSFCGRIDKSSRKIKKIVN